MKDWQHWNKRWNIPKSRHFHWASCIPWPFLSSMSSWKRKNENISRLFRKWKMNFPFADFTDTEEEYLLKIEVPGIEKDKISAKASEGTLTVEIEEEPYFYPLPPNVDTENIYATLKLGILTIHLPKKDPDKKVDIES
ncbi:MAG: Hsp20/alpha crystallin family protein [Candidatus Helarchaeota archaeon]